MTEEIAMFYLKFLEKSPFILSSFTTIVSFNECHCTENMVSK